MVMVNLNIACFSKSSEIDIPKISNDCLNGKCIDNQFFLKGKTKSFYFAIAIKEIELKMKPLYNSKTVLKLYPPESVIVLYKEKNVKLNEKFRGPWVFINLPFSNFQGWILESNLGYKSMFKVDPDWKIKRIEYYYGDLRYEIKFLDNRRYAGFWIDTYPASKGKKGNISGRFFRYNDVIYLKDNNSENHDLFIYLCDPQKEDGCITKIYK